MSERIVVCNDQTGKQKLRDFVSLSAPLVSAITNLTESSTITLNADYLHEYIVIGTSSMGGMSANSNLFGNSNPGAGKRVTLIGNSNVSPVLISKQNLVSSKQMYLKSDANLTLGASLTVVFIPSLDAYVEESRSI